MTRQQKQLVRESFPIVREIAGPVSLVFYGRLFELDPALRPLFRRDIEVQGRKLMDMLTAIVDNLDDFEGLAPALLAIGQRHAGYGVRPENYQSVARALTWALGQALDRDFRPEVKAAWEAIIESVSSCMKEGAAALPEQSAITKNAARLVAGRRAEK